TLQARTAHRVLSKKVFLALDGPKVKCPKIPTESWDWNSRDNTASLPVMFSVDGQIELPLQLGKRQT
ncbi:Hypothetical predicted protein, partial [Marmota monax]